MSTSILGLIERAVPTPNRALLWAAVAVPLLYYGTMLLSAAFFPGYNHVTRYASELGSNAATYPAIFNTGIVVTGIATVLASLGMYRAVMSIGTRPLFALVIAFCLALFGVGVIMGGLFPMPDPRHGGFGLGMTIHIVPFLLALALWKRTELRALARFLLANGLVMLVLFAIMMGVGALVTRSNVGLFQRAYSLTVFPWVGIVGYALLRRLR